MSAERAERMSWWRAHHGLPSHPRWLQAARKSGQPVPVTFAVAMWMLDHASRSEDRGSIQAFDVGPCAAYLWIDEADVSAVVGALNSIGWLDNGRIASWSGRQPIREDVSAAARKRAQREREAEAKSRSESETADASRNVTQDHDLVTQCHADVSPCHGREDKIREDKKEGSVLTNGPLPPPSVDPDADLFRRGKQVLGQNAGGQIAKLKAHFEGSIPKARAAIETASTKENAGEYIAAVIKGHGARASPAPTPKPQFKNPYLASALRDKQRADDQQSSSDNVIQHPGSPPAGRGKEAPILDLRAENSLFGREAASTLRYAD